MADFASRPEYAPGETISTYNILQNKVILNQYYSFIWMIYLPHNPHSVKTIAKNKFDGLEKNARKSIKTTESFQSLYSN